MIDEVISSGQSAPEQVSEPVNTNVASESAPTASETGSNDTGSKDQAQQVIEPEARQTRVYSRDEVNRIAAHAAEAARDKARADYERSMRADYERSKQYGQVGSAPQQQQVQQQQFDTAGMSEIERTRRHIQQIAYEESMRIEADKNRAEADSLIQKIIVDRVKYEDFESVTDVMNDIVTSDTARVFNGYENATDVIYHLGKNPESIPTILFEAARNPFNPNVVMLAKRALDKISQQLKANELAKVQPKANKPLEHEKPSTAGMDSGKMTIDDLRRQGHLRG